MPTEPSTAGPSDLRASLVIEQNQLLRRREELLRDLAAVCERLAELRLASQLVARETGNVSR